MPYKVEWHDNNRIFYIAFSDPFTEAELLAAFAEDKAQRDKVNHKMHTLIDVRNFKSPPPNTLRGRQSPSLSHPTSGHIAIFGAVPVMRNIAEVVFRLARVQKVKFFQNEADAWAYLRQIIADEDKNKAAPTASE